MYLRYIYKVVKQHDESMRYSTRGFKEGEMRIRLGYYAYHMRRWLRLLRRSRSLLSYPLPMSMQTSGGINRNITKVKLWPSSVSSVNSLLKIKAIQLNFGSVLADLARIYIKWLIEILNHSILYLFTQVRHHGIIAKNLTAMILSILGKWPSKPQMEKDNISLI